MRFGSICSGIGTPEAAWLPLGWECAFHSEIEPFPSAVLAHHYPEVPNLGDFTKIESGWTIDVLVGGTPCQSFSVAGKRAGLDDPRGNLTIEFARLVKRLRPRWFVWENVPGLLSIDGGRTFGTFLGIMGQLGYGFAYRVLDAQFFGVAQRRRRVFVVGCLGDWRRAAAVLFERDCLSGNPAPRREKREGITHSVAPCIGASGRGFERAGETRRQDCVVPVEYVPEISVTLNARDYKGPLPEADLSTVIAALHDQSPALERGGDGGPHSGVLAFAENQRGEIRTSEVAPQLSCAGGKPGSGYPAIAFSATLDGASQAVACFSADQSEGAGTIAYQEEQAPTLRGAASGTNQVPALHQGMAVRRLTPRECERLQGFSDGWTDITYKGKKAADGPRYKSLGNAMAVPVLSWIGNRLQMVEDLCNGNDS